MARTLKQNAIKEILKVEPRNYQRENLVFLHTLLTKLALKAKRLLASYSTPLQATAYLEYEECLQVLAALSTLKVESNKYTEYFTFKKIPFTNVRVKVKIKKTLKDYINECEVLQPISWHSREPGQFISPCKLQAHEDCILALKEAIELILGEHLPTATKGE